MNASNAFRTHLMQQFVAAARTQSRPPLALLSLTSEDDSRLPLSSGSSTHQSSAPHLVRRSSTTQARRSSLSSHVLPIPQSPSRSSSSSAYPVAQRRLLSSISLVDEEDREPVTSQHTAGVRLNSDFNSLEIPALFQKLLQTRRSCSRFASPLDNLVRDHSYWKEALDRAVECGLTAPNHKRTEPFRFKRMLSPSTSTARLAEIAYEVNMRQQVIKHGTDDMIAVEEAAARKRDKWSQIPAFLVTMVESSQDVVPTFPSHDTEGASEEDKANLDYEPLPYMAPHTERELEDYAAACAAVQNILLSLHAEHIASKWVTGSVVQTAAFRKLVQADPHDRVVALIMVGEPHPKSPQRPRRLHRPLEVVLQDLE